MTRSEARRVLDRLHAAQGLFYRGGSRKPLQALLTDDVSWTVPGRNSIAGTYRGIAEVFDYFERRRRIATRSLRLYPGEILVGDGETVARLTDGTATVNGIAYRWSTVGLYQLHDGRVAACWLLPFDPALFDMIWTQEARR
jgi:ketosteroid isomerase-like protein